MHRIDVPSATADNLFTEGSPVGGVPATVVAATWLNDLQETVCKAIELSGITLEKGDHTQLFDAIAASFAPSILAALGAGGVSSVDYIKVPFRDKTTGVKRFLTINVGIWNANASTSAVVTLPSAYSLIHFAAFGIDGGGSSLRTVALAGKTLQNVTFSFSGVADNFFFLSLGI